MNIPYLVEILGTNKLSEVVANMDMPVLDMNLAIWESIDRGEIVVDEENDTITNAVEFTPESDPDLRNKILRVIQHYARQETNITRGRLNSYIKDPITGNGYAWHEYIMATQHLIDDGTVIEQVVDIPEEKATTRNKKGKTRERVVRPAHKFAFLGLAENAATNEEWNSKAVNKWLADIEASLLR